MKLQFPEDYKTLLQWSNGGEGSVGTIYLSLWGIEEIEKFNEDYRINRYLPGLLGIGTDGGGECYALDYRASPIPPSFIQVPLGDLDFASITVLGATFRDGIKNVISA